MKPCTSHITALRKVSTKLAWKLTMNGSTLILGEENKKKVEAAEKKIYEAMAILKEVE